MLPFFSGSEFLRSANLLAEATQVTFTDGRLVFGQAAVNSYLASVAADFLRQKLLVQRVSFTFETVMSAREQSGVAGAGTGSGLSNLFVFRGDG